MSASTVRLFSWWPLLAPLAYRNFALLWFGRIVSLAGDQFQLVALAAVALDLTQSAAGLGTVLMVQAVPRALFMLFGGAATDRFRPRMVMLVSDAAQAFAVLVLTLLAANGNLALWHLYVYAAVSGTVYAFFLPAANTIVPDLVPREQVRS
ncbi:MAG TPA: MFS transporter, partial [Chloroflexota bacterium]|nr:MFS transporter [Chloroflexota bacterium]